jgi:hypothetical protein
MRSQTTGAQKFNHCASFAKDFSIVEKLREILHYCIKNEWVMDLNGVSHQSIELLEKFE